MLCKCKAICTAPTQAHYNVIPDILSNKDSQKLNKINNLTISKEAGTDGWCVVPTVRVDHTVFIITRSVLVLHSPISTLYNTKHSLQY